MPFPQRDSGSAILEFHGLEARVVQPGIGEIAVFKCAFEEIDLAEIGLAEVAIDELALLILLIGQSPLGVVVAPECAVANDFLVHLTCC